jgi:anaerobic magnesium-protoporphyrin IX monomethyl ester cyclase
MSCVLLTHSNHIFSDVKQTDKMQPYPPLQTLLAAAVLRQHAIGVQLFDPALCNSGQHSPAEDFSQAVHRHNPWLIAVCEDDFNFLSKMCLAHNRELACAMAKVAMAAGVPAIAHGHDASDHPDEYLGAGFSAVLIGEVEATLLELAQGKPREDIAGLAYLNEGTLRRNPARPLHTNLDDLPAPAWDLADIEAYRHAWKSKHGYFSINMASSRGCPFRCNWCAKPIHGNSYHARSPESVASEMLYLKNAFHPDHIWFADDIFALSPRWTFEFADTVERLGARVPFKMQSRCDLMTRSTVSALRDAGANEIWMGAESGSQHILDAMDKGIQVNQIYEARENLRRNGIRACFFLQFGYPGEEWAEIEQTIRMVRETAPDDIGVSVSYPLPGTRFHQIVRAQLGSRANWNHSADLTMMFRGAFSTEFYRALADALHLEVRGGTGVAEAWRRVHELRHATPLAEVA